MKKKNTLPDLIYERQAELCSALANPVRLKILDLLAEQEYSAKDLGELLDLPKSNISQHLSVLKNAGILQVRSEGLYQFLSLTMPEVKQACNMVKKMLIAKMEKETEFMKTMKVKIS
jgi:DNA-binding transcriptional ArsR family regulator